MRRRPFRPFIPFRPWLLIACLLTALAAPAPAAGGILGQTDVFVSGRGGYFGYRIPALVTAPDGTLLAFAEARKNNLGDPGGKGNTIDLVMKRSRDGGRTWQAMQVIEHAGALWSSANPAPVVDHWTGRVWLLYIRNKPGKNSNNAQPGGDDVRNLARWSDDNGATWSEPADLTAVARDLKDPQWRSSFAGPCGVIQDRQGRLVAPIWRVSQPWGVFAIFSEDHGRTWQRGALVPGQAGGDENQLVELAGGRLLMDIRQKGVAHRWFAESADGGRTWGQPRPGLAATPCCCSILRVPLPQDGKGPGAIIWSGPAGPGRKKLVLRVSRDEGQTFPLERQISPEDAAYSALTLLQDQSIGVLWERGNYTQLTFTRLAREVIEPEKK